MRKKTRILALVMAAMMMLTACGSKNNGGNASSGDTNNDAQGTQTAEKVIPEKTDKDTPRPYVFPGPKWLSTLLIRIAELIAIGTCVLFVWTPGVPINMTQLVFVVIGAAVVLGLGVVLMKVAEKEKTAPAE